LASIIKQKYESDGDLGSVAKSSKGKQWTLGFGAKPKPLLGKEVLAVLRKVASTTGAQSQKWKGNKIKKLMVRAQGPEATYIICGVQGKLRIGLTQSTLLISLAHIVTLTPPEGVDMDCSVEGTSIFCPWNSFHFRDAFISAL
jgi:DNA ligase-1